MNSDSDAGGSGSNPRGRGGNPPVRQGATGAAAAALGDPGYDFSPKWAQRREPAAPELTKLERFSDSARRLAEASVGSGTGAIYWRISSITDLRRERRGLDGAEGGESSGSPKGTGGDSRPTGAAAPRTGKRDGPKGANSSRLISRARAIAAKVADAEQGAVCIARLATVPGNWRLCVEVSNLIRSRFEGKTTMERNRNTPVYGARDWAPTLKNIAEDVEDTAELVHLVACMSKRVSTTIGRLAHECGLTWGEITSQCRLEPIEWMELDGPYVVREDGVVAIDPSKPGFDGWYGEPPWVAAAYADPSLAPTRMSCKHCQHLLPVYDSDESEPGLTPGHRAPEVPQGDAGPWAFCDLL